MTGFGMPFGNSLNCRIPVLKEIAAIMTSHRISSLSLFLAVIFPMTAWADAGHSEEVAHGGGLGIGTLLFLFFGLIFLITLIIYVVNKQKKKQSSLWQILWIGALAGTVITGGYNLAASNDKGSVNMTHIHGLGYTPDGARVLFAAHDGLKQLSADGHWSEAPGPKHDYMGFSIYDQGFYSSGHPAPGSGLKNPFGIVKSTDYGQTLEFLSLYGHIDFHLMGVGYKSHIIYVYNPEPHPQMKEAGLHYTIDEGKTWIRSGMAGLGAVDATALAVHPTEPSTIALGTTKALYVSKDYGKTFSVLLEGRQITALSYSLQGKLFAGTYQGGKPGLTVWDSGSTGNSREWSLPALTEDAPAYLGIHPGKETEVTLATFQRDVYRTTDSGNGWTQLAKQGKNK